MISWADTERDLSAWLGNAMQSNALHELVQTRRPAQGKGRRAASVRLAQADLQRPFLLHVHQVLGRRRRAQVFQPLRKPVRQLHQFHERAGQRAGPPARLTRGADNAPARSNSARRPESPFDISQIVLRHNSQRRITPPVSRRKMLKIPHPPPAFRLTAPAIQLKIVLVHRR